MSRYYYFSAALPPLEFPVPPENTGSVDLRASLKMNLSKKDYEQVQSLYLLIDLLNVKRVFREKEIDPRGNLNEEELNEALLAREFFPDYVFDFFQRHDTLEEKNQYFPSLLAEFFRREIEKTEGFLRDYLTFERELRLVLLALRAKSLKRNLLLEMQFEDPTDPFVLSILAQKDAEVYEPPVEYRELRDLWTATGSDPLRRSMAIAEYRFRKAGEMGGCLVFSLDFLLSYLTRLMMIEHWNELNKEKGQVVLSTLE